MNGRINKGRLIALPYVVIIVDADAFDHDQLDPLFAYPVTKGWPTIFAAIEGLEGLFEHALIDLFDQLAERVFWVELVFELEKQGAWVLIFGFCYHNKNCKVYTSKVQILAVFSNCYLRQFTDL